MSLAQELYEAAALDEIKVPPGGFPVGTKRKRKPGLFLKVRPGLWRRIRGDTGVLGTTPEVANDPKAVKRAQDEMKKLPGTVSALKAAIDAGYLPRGVSLGQHIKDAKDAIRENEAASADLLRELRRIEPEGEVTGRVKTIESTLGKLVRKHHKEIWGKDENGDPIPIGFDYSKPHIQRVSQMGDITGTRIIREKLSEVDSSVIKLRKFYGDRVVSFDDRTRNPQDGYRAVHMDIIDHDGRRKEIQVRTRRQQLWADWNHDFYKPINEKQMTWKEATERAVVKTFKKYAIEMSDYFFALDEGKKAVRPECPAVVSESPFGCMKE